MGGSYEHGGRTSGCFGSGERHFGLGWGYLFKGDGVRTMQHVWNLTLHTCLTIPIEKNVEFCGLCFCETTTPRMTCTNFVNPALPLFHALFSSHANLRIHVGSMPCPLHNLGTVATLVLTSSKVWRCAQIGAAILPYCSSVKDEGARDDFFISGRCGAGEPCDEPYSISASRKNSFPRSVPDPPREAPHLPSSRQSHAPPTTTLPKASGSPTTPTATFRASVRCPSFIVWPSRLDPALSISGVVALSSESR